MIPTPFVEINGNFISLPVDEKSIQNFFSEKNDIKIHSSVLCEKIDYSEENILNSLKDVFYCESGPQFQIKQNKNIEMKFEKIIIQKKGDSTKFEASSIDSEFFGYLIVTLPSFFSGGNSKLKLIGDHKRTMNFSISKNLKNSFQSNYIAFCNICEYESTKITEGVKIDLVYKLYTPPNNILKHIDDSNLPEVDLIIQNYFDIMKLLNDFYDEKNLKFEKEVVFSLNGKNEKLFNILNLNENFFLKKVFGLPFTNDFPIKNKIIYPMFGFKGQGIFIEFKKSELKIKKKKIFD